MWFALARSCALSRSAATFRLGIMAQERLKTIVGHLKGGGMTNVISMFEDKNILEEVNKKIGAAQSKGGFRFTLDNCRLSDEQRRFYEDNGFIVIRNLVPLRDLETYKTRFQEIADGKVKVPGLVVMKDITKREADHSEYVVNKLQELYMDDVLFSYCTLPQILDYACSFCGPNLTAVHTMLINKPPDTGALTSRHPLHQDLYYFPFRPADRIVCAWTAMEKVTRENGCLVAIPGSHHGELMEHGYPEWEGGVNKMYHGVKGLADSVFDKRVYLEMEAGDTVFFHPVLIHGSGANRTKGFRKAISCHYAASECQYIDVEGSVQDPIAEEVLDIFRKRFPNIAVKNYADVWKLRARHVRGKEGNL
uniref:phytanoyl-CoA dioxygenase n=1 Tax=Amblyomma maculatum TaxID=34609 RepID=G3MQG7_AMBMU